MKNYAVYFGFKKRGCEFKPLFGLTVSTSSKVKAKWFASELIEDMTPKEFEAYLICESNSIDYQSIMYAITESKFDLSSYHCEVEIL